MTEFRIDLEQARKRAKELLRRARAGDEDAIARLRADRTPRLAGAQHAVARELGFESWRALKHAVEVDHASFDERGERFVQDATVGRLDRARRWLDADPEIAEAGLHSALVLGDRDRVAVALRRDPELPRRSDGPRDWPPLLYVCHSYFLGRDPERTIGLVETGRLLLEAGADPNATATSPNWPGSVWTPLYGAAGVAHEPQLTKLVLEAGANPDDGESVYHACETRDHAALQLLLDAGAAVNGTNALPHMLDYDDFEGLRILLEAGADPNALHHAIVRGRDVPFIELLVAHGADLERRRRDGLTPYRLAVRRARPELAETLVRLGAKAETELVDQFLATCLRGDEEAVHAFLRREPRLVERLQPHEHELIVEASTFDDPTAMRVMLDVGFPLDARGELEGTPLHHASWWGRAPAVELLLDHGAQLEAGSWFGPDSTPLAWAANGSHGCPGRDGDWLTVTALLVRAGARVDPALVEEADGELADLLRERLTLGGA